MLAIDVGNSRIKFAIWEDGAWQNYTSHEYDIKTLPNLLDKFFENIITQPVHVSCVVDAVKDSLSRWFKKRWGKSPVFYHSTHELAGVTNAYAHPNTLGVDRWLVMIAAFNAVRSPVCIIDCGTAVTLDVISNDGTHQGGLIMPGLRVMQESLLSRTSNIHVFSGSICDLAKNTGDAVESGCVQLLAMGLDGLSRKHMDIYPDLRVVMTGGDAKRIAKHMHVKSHYVETLVLDGLRIVADLGS